MTMRMRMMASSRKSRQQQPLWRLLLLLAVVLLVTSSSFCQAETKEDEEDNGDLQCSLSAEELAAPDPALREMTFDIGDGPQTTLVYVEPPIAEFYKDEAPSLHKVTPKFNGFAGKFINMSNQKVTLYWEQTVGGKKIAMRNHNPFTASGTATFPTHSFVFCADQDPDTILIRFTVQTYPENIYVYDPYLVEGDAAATQANLEQHMPSSADRQQYDQWRKTLAYNEIYRNFTGRSYLANFLRDPPRHHMWPCQYFGQQHSVETRETHFVRDPPADLLGPVLDQGRGSSTRQLTDAAPRLAEYRMPGRLNMTLTAISVAPRAFQIDNFLSATEVDHITELASGIKLSKSATGDTNAGETRIEASDGTNTRTSYNSWVSRTKSPMVDAIYRRAAHVLRIDEALLRQRSAAEQAHVPDWMGDHRKTLAEDLQLVNYKNRQEYTSHHDFGYSRIDGDQQGARFATLLLYLNEGMTGGETSFPRWVNAETFRELKIVPEVGKAVLFYSQLPDGNLDDFSQHAAQPVTDGEKWLINLWVWDPVYN